MGPGSSWGTHVQDFPAPDNLHPCWEVVASFPPLAGTQAYPLGLFSEQVGRGRDNLEGHSRTFSWCESCRSLIGFSTPGAWQDSCSSPRLPCSGLQQAEAQPSGGRRPSAILAHLPTPGAQRASWAHLPTAPCAPRGKMGTQANQSIYGFKREPQEVHRGSEVHRPVQEKPTPKGCYRNSQKVSPHEGPCSFPNLLTLEVPCWKGRKFWKGEQACTTGERWVPLLHGFNKHHHQGVCNSDRERFL